MKKKILLILMVIALAMPALNTFAAATNILTGKSFNIGDSYGDTRTTTTYLTDNDMSTKYNLNTPGSTHDTVWYSFGTNTTVNTFEVIGETGKNYSLYVHYGDGTTESFQNKTGTFTTNITKTVQGIYVTNVNTADTLMLYEVKAFDGTTTDTTAPGEVTNLTALPSDGEVKISFTTPVDSDLDGYKIYQDGVLKLTRTTEVLPNSNYSHTYVNLTNGTNYNFKVTTLDSNGNESSGTSVNTTPELAADTTAPLEVTNVTTNVTENSVTLNFTNPTDPDFAKVNIYKDGVLHGDSTTGTYTLSSLTAATSYSIKLTSVDSTGNESPGVIKTVTTLDTADTVAPNAPTGLTVTTGNAALYTQWSSSTEADFSHYNIYVNGTKENTAPITSNSFNITGLTNDTSYSIQVSAVDESGNESTLSLAITGTPSAEAIPLISMGYSLVDVADGTASWFSSLWLIIAFATAIPLSFYVAGRIKLLFLD